MPFSNDILIRIAIFFLGVCGFLVARHIRNHKVKNTPLICPVGFDCHAVVHSDYSKFLGVPVEIFGLIYYFLISVAYFSSIFFYELLPEAFTGFMVVISLFAFIFSMYLIAVQIFILKKGCSWCIVSALISTVIFILIVWK